METTLADGRALEHVTFGDPGGHPVVLFPGTPATAGGGVLVADAAAAQGVRLIAVSRPGYGGSTASAPGLASVAQDALELLDALGLERVGVHGISGGGPFALALAAVAPERVDSVVVSAGPGSHAELGGLSPTASAAMESARSGDHDAAWRMLHAEAAHLYGDAAAMSCAEFQTHLFSSGPPPQSYFDGRAELFRVFVADMHRAVQHLDGYVRDILSWCGAWDIDIATARAPVLLAYGRDDQMTLPAHGEWLDARLLNSQLRICPGGHGDIAFGLAADAYAYLVIERT